MQIGLISQVRKPREILVVFFFPRGKCHLYIPMVIQKNAEESRGMNNSNKVLIR